MLIRVLMMRCRVRIEGAPMPTVKFDAMMDSVSIFDPVTIMKQKTTGSIVLIVVIPRVVEFSILSHHTIP